MSDDDIERPKRYFGHGPDPWSYVLDCICASSDSTNNNNVKISQRERALTFLSGTLASVHYLQQRELNKVFCPPYAHRFCMVFYRIFAFAAHEHPADVAFHTLPAVICVKIQP